MNKKPLCVECAFRLNVENNHNAIVMSINSNKLEDRCHKCDSRIGHSKELNRLIGIYHEKRHEESEEPRRNAGLLERFGTYKNNKYNGDTLTYLFIMAIKYQKYGKRTVRDYFHRLVAKEDVEMFDKKKLLEELIEMTMREEGQSPVKID